MLDLLYIIGIGIVLFSVLGIMLYILCVAADVADWQSKITCDKHERYK